MPPQTHRVRLAAHALVRGDDVPVVLQTLDQTLSVGRLGELDDLGLNVGVQLFEQAVGARIAQGLQQLVAHQAQAHRVGRADRGELTAQPKQQRIHRRQGRIGSTQLDLAKRGISSGLAGGQQIVGGPQHGLRLPVQLQAGGGVALLAAQRAQSSQRVRLHDAVADRARERQVALAPVDLGGAVVAHFRGPDQTPLRLDHVGQIAARLRQREHAFAPAGQFVRPTSLRVHHRQVVQRTELHPWRAQRLAARQHLQQGLARFVVAGQAYRHHRRQRQQAGLGRRPLAL